eukprot:scaffold79712_cov18-Prasinocladus_malaysianus.AAC.1
MSAGLDRLDSQFMRSSNRRYVPTAAAAATGRETDYNVQTVVTSSLPESAVVAMRAFYCLNCVQLERWD